MTRIAILADSGCQIELKQYENQGIYIVPLCITMKNHTYLDQQDITSLEVFETMEKEDIMVMTSQPATGELVNILQRIKDAGYDEVIGLPIATGLSSTLNGMKVASEMVDIPITLIDTKGTAGNQKYLVFTAAKLVQEGKSIKEIQVILEDMIQHSGTIIMAPNLEHLKKGGRITPAVALLASMLKIVPVMELNYDLGGKIDVLGKVRTLSKAKATLVNRMVELGVNAKEYKITIEHVLCESSALDVKQMVLDKIGEVELELRELPAVVGAHMGVGGIGVQYIKKYYRVGGRMMPLFDDFTKKAAKFTEEAIDKTQELAGTAKLKLKMKNLESDRDDVFRELGKYYYQQIHDSGVIDDEVMEMYRHIGEYNDKIEELKDNSMKARINPGFSFFIFVLCYNVREERYI